MRVLADATWGVTTTFSIASSGLSGSGGSCSSTSSPAPAIVPLRSASMSARSSMIGPRAVLTITAVGFICASAAALIACSVSSLCGAWTDRKSLRANNSAKVTGSTPAALISSSLT